MIFEVTEPHGRRAMVYAAMVCVIRERDSMDGDDKARTQISLNGALVFCVEEYTEVVRRFYAALRGELS